MHDPTVFATELSRKLNSSERHVAFLTGAGSSVAAGIPDMGALQTSLIDAAAQDAKPGVAIAMSGRSLEEGLTWIRKLRSLLEDSTDQAFGLDYRQAADTDEYITRHVMGRLTQASQDAQSHDKFATWVRQTRYTTALEVFTLNYDLMFETAFDRASVPYFDGFLGDYEAAFRSDLVDAIDADQLMPSFFARVWKLHGSISWSATTSGAIVRRGVALQGDAVAAIHPSEAKYDSSRRAPYVILQDRFRRSLLEPETILVVAGYSLGDQHINEIIFTAARARPRSEFYFAMHSDVIPDVLQELAAAYKNVVVTTPARAIIGGVEAEWAASSSLHPAESYWQDDRLTLGDFSRLQHFLAREPVSGTPSV